MKKCFVLGVGAQKCGTSWLHGYLSNNINANFGALKEYHIWDALYVQECHNFVAHKDDVLRFRLQNEKGAYEKYFSSLICNGINLTGDITPSYSGLSADCFSLIRDKIESNGFDLKVVFLMRDPFERCWSAVRMARLNTKKVLYTSELDQLEAAYKTKNFIIRTAYNLTIEALEIAFSLDQIYYGIYEELFNDQKIEELSNFVGVPYVPDFSRKKFNVSPKSNDEPVALKSEIKEFYSDVYDYCFKRFPQTKSLWC